MGDILINMSDYIKAYWWTGAGNKNFGDVLGPELIKHFTGKQVEFSSPENSDIVTVGSISEHLPDGYSGTIAGIGMARRSTRKDFSRANVLAVRGAHTLSRINFRGKVVLGDPGLIATDLVKDLNKEKKYEYGIISHYSDSTAYLYKDSFYIDIRDPIEKVIKEAAQCKAIVTSSLHGLILADALRLPRLWKKYARTQGNGFKFLDYGTSIEQAIRPNIWMTANWYTIREKQEQLREIFTCL